MGFLKVYRALLQDVQDGKYGSQMQQLSQIPYAAIDADKYLYSCKSCGHWEVAPSMTLYAPNDPELIHNKQYGIKSVKEWGYVPYVMEYDLKRDYHRIKAFYHICPDCGKRMIKITSDKGAIYRKLRCPKCGSDDVSCESLHWD